MPCSPTTIPFCSQLLKWHSHDPKTRGLNHHCNVVAPLHFWYPSLQHTQLYCGVADFNKPAATLRRLLLNHHAYSPISLVIIYIKLFRDHQTARYNDVRLYVELKNLIACTHRVLPYISVSVRQWQACQGEWTRQQACSVQQTHSHKLGNLWKLKWQGKPMTQQSGTDAAIVLAMSVTLQAGYLLQLPHCEDITRACEDAQIAQYRGTETVRFSVHKDWALLLQRRLQEESSEIPEVRQVQTLEASQKECASCWGTAQLSDSREAFLKQLSPPLYICSGVAVDDLQIPWTGPWAFFFVCCVIKN